MMIPWFARIIIIVLALGPAGHAFASQISPVQQQPGLVSVPPLSSSGLPVNAICIGGFAACQNGHSGTGACGIVLAVVQDHAVNIADMYAAKGEVPGPEVVVRPDPAGRFFRPPRA